MNSKPNAKSVITLAGALALVLANQSVLSESEISESTVELITDTKLVSVSNIATQPLVEDPIIEPETPVQSASDILGSDGQTLSDEDGLEITDESDESIENTVDLNIESLDPNANNASDSSLVSATASAAVTEIERALYQVESQFDAYDPSISELSQDLGARLAEIGQYPDALKAYRRALHVLRINEGLDSERQIPILENIVETHYKAGQAEEAGEVLERLSFVYNRNFGGLSPATIPLLLSRGNWHLSAASYSAPNTTLRHLQEAFNAYSQVASISSAHGLPYNNEVYEVLTTTTYQIALIGDAAQSKPARIQALSNRDLLRDSLAREQQNTGSSAYRRGKLQIKRAIAHAEASGDPEHKALALIQMGDWEQLFRKRFSAREHYLQAYEYAVMLEEDNELLALFDTPKRLPDFDTVDRLTANAGKNDQPLRVSLDVSPWGAARNAELVVDIDQPLGAGPRNLNAERRALRRAASSIYRPRIVDGAAVGATNVVQTVKISR